MKGHVFKRLFTVTAAVVAAMNFTAVYASQTAEGYGDAAYNYLQYIYDNFPERTNDKNSRSDSVDKAGDWLVSELSGMGYDVNIQEYIHGDSGYYGTNYSVIKEGSSDDIIVVGAHYDSEATAGIDDNGSGVSVVLELAERFYGELTPCTVIFAFYDGEENGGYVGSYYFVNEYLEANGLLENVLCNINIDSVGGGDRLYGYGGEYETDGSLTREWVYNAANLIADENDIPLFTLPDEVEEFKSPTRITGSDQHYYNAKKIPYLYLEASLWCNDDGSGGNSETALTCHYQTADSAFSSTGGQIMHTSFDDLDTLNELLPGRIKRNLSNTSRLVSLMLNTVDSDTPSDASGYEPAEHSSKDSLLAEDNIDYSTIGTTDEAKSHMTALFIVIGLAIIIVILLLLRLTVTSRGDRFRKRRNHKSF